MVRQQSAFPSSLAPSSPVAVTTQPRFFLTYGSASTTVCLNRTQGGLAMRPTGVVLIAVYHLISALFLVFLAVSLVVGGSVLGAMFGAGHENAMGGLNIGLLIGMVGAVFFVVLALI